jgi:hypothetical protein
MPSRLLALVPVLLLASVGTGCLERLGHGPACGKTEAGRCVAYEIDLDAFAVDAPPVEALAAPGARLVVLPPATPVADRRAAQQREARRKLTGATGDTALMPRAAALRDAPAGPASIVELARALKGDPDLIYEYIRNNIAFYPIWGIHKGAVGTILDKQGTAFDQAAPSGSGETSGHSWIS